MSDSANERLQKRADDAVSDFEDLFTGYPSLFLAWRKLSAEDRDALRAELADIIKRKFRP
jgi:hypothetical protein